MLLSIDVYGWCLNKTLCCMMRCKVQNYYNYITGRVFQNMDSSNNSNKERCSCAKPDTSCDTETSNADTPSTSKDRRSRINLFGLCRDKSSPFGLKKSNKSASGSNVAHNLIKKSPKLFKYLCTKIESKVALNQENQNCCWCTCSKKVNESNSKNKPNMENKDINCRETQVTDNNSQTNDTSEIVESSSSREDFVEIEPSTGIRGIYGTAPATSSIPNIIISAPFLDMQWIRTQHEDCEEAARMERAREIEQGVEAPANFRSLRRVQLLCSDMEESGGQSQAPRRLQLVCPPDLSVESLRALFQNHVTLMSCPMDSITGCHTQVDFIHCLVPDLLTITNCSFYWGKMDRYEAERLLDGKPEGTFLLRDSAQEEFLFSVSFRKYGRSLHARIEQWNHKFSFDSHDPGVFTSKTVCGLIEHYKDPTSCMFFEPILTWPLHRKFTFSLQHLSRAAIVSRLTYDDINHLQLPKTLKTYLKEYHYRQKVRVERFDDDVQWLELRKME